MSENFVNKSKISFDQVDFEAKNSKMESEVPIKVEPDGSEDYGPDIKLEPEESDESEDNLEDPTAFDGFKSEPTGKFHDSEYLQINIAIS